MIREEDPSPLSSINRSFRGDIETIVGKALEKEKDRRYSTVGDMAADLRHHLRDEPIVARRVTAAYRARKFVRRNRVLVTSTVVIILVLVAGVVASTTQAYRALQAEKLALEQKERATVARQRAVEQSEIAQRERNNAREQEGLAERERNAAVAEKLRADESTSEALAVNSFLLNDLLAQADIQNQGAGDKPDPDLKVRTALDRAARNLQGRFAAQPLVEASLRRTLGASFAGLALLPEARNQFERELELRLRNQGELSRDTIDCRMRIIRLAIAEGKYRAAFEDADKLAKVAAKVAAPSDPLRVESQALLGTTYLRMGNFPEALQIMKPLPDLIMRAKGRESTEYMTIESELAAACEGERFYGDALDVLEPLAELETKVLGRDHAATLETRRRIGTDLIQFKEWDKAESVLREVLAAYERLRGSDHPATIAALDGLATAFRLSNHPDEALPYVKDVYARRLRTLGPDHPDTLTAYDYVGAIYGAQHRLQEALEVFRAVRAARQRVLGPEHTSTLAVTIDIAIAYAKSGDFAEAERTYREALRMARAQKDPPFISVISSMNGTEGMLYRQGKFAEAEEMEKEIIAYRRAVRSYREDQLTDENLILASIYYKEKKFAECEQLATATIRRALELQVTSKLYIYIGQSLLGGILARQGKQAEAIKLLEEGYKGLESMRSNMQELSLFYLAEAKNRLEKKGLD